MHGLHTYDPTGPKRLDEIARRIARREGKSPNEMLMAALRKGLGMTEHSVRYSDLDDLVGTWVHDPEFDRAMDRIDAELWK